MGKLRFLGFSLLVLLSCRFDRNTTAAPEEPLADAGPDAPPETCPDSIVVEHRQECRSAAAAANASRAADDCDVDWVAREGWE